MKKEVLISYVREGAQTPIYVTEGSAGFDLYAAEHVTVGVGETKLVRTGIAVALPDGFEMQVRSRSGLALKKSVFVLNAPGTIDADYRGEIGVILHNAGTEKFVVEVGDRIAQGVLTTFVNADFDLVDTLPETRRGAGGFGHSGVK